MKKVFLSLFFICCFSSLSAAEDCSRYFYTQYSPVYGVTYIHKGDWIVFGKAGFVSSYSDHHMRFTYPASRYNAILSDNHCEFLPIQSYLPGISEYCASLFVPDAIAMTHPFIVDGVVFQECYNFYWLGGPASSCTPPFIEYTSVSGVTSCVDPSVVQSGMCADESCPFIYQAWDNVYCGCQNKYCTPPLLLDYETGECVQCIAPQMWSSSLSACVSCPDNWVADLVHHRCLRSGDADVTGSGFTVKNKSVRRSGVIKWGRGGYEIRD